MDRTLHIKKQTRNGETKAYNLDASSKQALLEDLPEVYFPWVDLASKIGVEGIDVVMDVFGSEKPHVPTRKNFWLMAARNLRNKTMRRLFHPTDYGYAHLAREFSGFMGLGRLSERQVREIIDHHHKPRARRKESCAPMKIPNSQHTRIANLAKANQVSQNDAINAILSALGEDQLQAIIAGSTAADARKGATPLRLVQNTAGENE